MTLLLNVPFSEKDEARKLGAWWNPQIKKWYVKEKKDYFKFTKWISKEDEFSIVCDQIYIVEGERKCWKCNKNTRVIAFGAKDIIFLSQNMDSFDFEKDDDIHIISSLHPIPASLLEYVQNKYNYRNTYSKKLSTSYLANCCDHCKALQGDYFLFSEVDSPFFINDAECAKRLKLFKVNLQYDLVFDLVNVLWSSNDYLIEKYAEKIPCEIELYPDNL